MCSLRPESAAAVSAIHPADHSDAGLWKAEASVLLTDCPAVASNAESFGLHAAKTRLVTKEVMHIVLERREPGYSTVSGIRGKARASEVALPVTRSQMVGIFRQPQPCEAFHRPRYEWHRQLIYTNRTAECKRHRKQQLESILWVRLHLQTANSCSWFSGSVHLSAEPGRSNPVSKAAQP